MPLFLKELKKEKRSAWLFYPNMPNRSEIKVCSVTVVKPEASEESVQRLLRAGLEQLAQEKHLILCFPNPEERGWNQDRLRRFHTGGNDGIASAEYGGHGIDWRRSG